jgi:anti-anti-sigma factor
VDGVKAYEFERQPEYWRLILGADQNAFHWEDLQQRSQEILAELTSGRYRAVIVDLTHLEYLGSAQLTVLVRIWKVIKERSGRMIIELKAPVVREVLKTAGLLNVWEVAESRDGALRMLGLQADGQQRMSMVMPAIGLAALVAAVAGTCLVLWRPDVVDARTLLAGQLASAAIALGTGLWTAMRASGFRRVLGAGLVVVAAIVAVAAVFHHPRGSTAAAPRGAADGGPEKARKPVKAGKDAKKPKKSN